MTALLFGSIGTLADTSELQREAFNQAFERHQLDWRWSQDEYQHLLTQSGGAARVAAYAESRGSEVDAAAVHAAKSEIFQQRLRDAAVAARPGVVATIDAARAAGAKVALITTTSAENIAALGSAIAPEVDLNSFDLVLSVDDVDEPKPAPDVYRLALERLGETADGVMAIEDNLGGVQAAAAAGLRVIAFPGENNSEGDFAAASATTTELSPGDLEILSDGAQS